MASFNTDRFLKEGAVVLDNESHNSWNTLKSSISDRLGVEDLSDTHKHISEEQINEKRLDAFQSLNRIESWDKLYFSMARNTITDLLGPDLLIQRKLNLSIQMPNDKSSLLGIHADTLSGQSPFELVMWAAFSDFPKEAGMYYFDREISKKILSEMATNEDKGLDYLREKYWDKRNYLNIKKGEIAIFSGTIFHGNTVNETSQTRVSINCRFKNLFSPEGSDVINERGAGIFYQLLIKSPITDIALKYLDEDIQF